MTNAILEAFYSLGRNINKARGKIDDLENEQGIVSEKFPELKLDMPNEDLIALTAQWKKAWTDSVVYTDWQKHGEENEAYWLGNQHVKPKVEKTRPTIDNAIFEALETYLPEATKRNPDPMVKLDEDEEQTDEGQKFTVHLQKKLAEIADELKLRLKLKKAARHWAIYLLGAAKLGWDMDRDIPTVKIIRGKKLILDPEATVDEDGYTGEYVGEYRKLQASVLIRMLSKMGAEQGAEQVIKDLVKDDLGTEVQFIEWWTAEYMCWTLNNHVLTKKKNPHWNYEGKEEAPADERTGETPKDENGQPMMVDKQVQPNHFKTPRLPYVFLSVFNLGKQPVDETSLIGQNISTQDRINKRARQIDRNADSMNNGMVVSLERSGLTGPQANNVTKALRDGGTVTIPAGSVNEAMSRMSAPPLPPDVYRDLSDQRTRLSQLFGSQGLTPSGLGSNKTVRGMMFEHNLATDRIGGGVSEYLEQFADDIYNWFVQLLYVYDDDYATDQTQRPAVNVGVKEGSMLPKDTASLAQQAIELAKMGKMSLVDLYKALDRPNPEEMAANVWLEANAPEILFGSDQRVAQAIQMKQAAQAGAGGKPPSESINFKDLPPEGKAQMAKKAGIDLHPEAVAAHEEHAAGRGRSTPVIPQPQEEQGLEGQPQIQ
jgi:hypothetical protein